MSEEIEKKSSGASPLNIVAKALFIIAVILMAVVSCRTYSCWWLIGYIIVGTGALNAISNYKLPDDRAVCLIICDVILLVLTYFTWGSHSVWWPIIWLIIGICAAGGLQNQMDSANGETDNQSVSGEQADETESREKTEPLRRSNPAEKINSPIEENSLSGSSLKLQISRIQLEMIEIARTCNQEKISDYTKTHIRDKIFQKAVQDLSEEALAEENPNKLFTVGIFMFIEAVNQNNIQECAEAFRLIAIAAGTGLGVAEYMIGYYYKCYKNEFTIKAKKDFYFQLFSLVSDVCDPEKCYQRQQHRLG